MGVFSYFCVYPNDAGTVSLDIGSDICSVEVNALLRLCGVLCYC
jgi:hypothetical protein